MGSSYKAAGAMLALLLAAGPARADQLADSLATGAPVLAAGDGIDLVSREIEIARGAVRVRSVYRNRGPRDVTRALSFRLPDRLSEFEASQLAFAANVRTLVDGRPAPLTGGPRALAGETDHSDEIRRLGLPILYLGDAFEPVSRALAALPRADQERLAALQLIEIFETTDGTRQLMPRWTIREAWTWDQVFPAGRDVVVEHVFAPGIAGEIEVGVNSQALRNSEYGQGMIRDYCLGDEALAAYDRLSAPRGDDYPGVGQYRLTYDFAGAEAPIAEFRLTVDAGAEGNVASFCGEGVRRVGPSRFELRRSNWRPAGPLRIIFFEPESAR
jgi:hypothetical protein